MSATILGGAIAGGLQLILKILPGMLRSDKTKSLIHFTKSTRVEPIALVDQRLTSFDYTKDVMQTLNSIFISYYLQAAAVAVNVGRVNVVRLLDSLNPRRDVAEAGAAAAEYVADMLSYSDMQDDSAFARGLPFVGLDGKMTDQSVQKATYGWKASVESAVNPTVPGTATVKTNVPQFDKFGNPTGNKVEDTVVETKEQALQNVKIGGDKLNSMVHEAVNLSVGRLVEVTVEDQGKTATFPLQVRLIVSILSGGLLTHILGDTGRNVTMKERYHAWRAGQLEFIKDLVLCQDIIEAHRKALMKDESGTYAEILERRKVNSRARWLSGRPSIGTASNIVVISKQTATQVESEIGGRLSEVKTRDRLMNNTYMMLLAVVDTDNEFVTIYHNGINLPTKASIRELKVSNKGNGPDMAEILKAYQLGQNPSI